MVTKWEQLADEQAIQKTTKSLERNGIEAVVLETGVAAKAVVLEMIPAGAEVMTMSSTTLDTMGLAEEINKPGSKFKSVRARLAQMKQLGSVPEVAVGSVQAVTEEGQVLMASNTGSQLAAYVYGADKVIWVVGAQKIVKNIDEGMKRIYEYVLPLEDARARKAYGVGSNVSKLLIINKEVRPGRVRLILVRENLGF